MQGAPSQPGALIIGGSIIGSGGIPQALAAMVPDWHVQFETVAKATLEEHLERPASEAAISARPWRAVILQEQGLRPLDNPDAMQRSVAAWAARSRAIGAEPCLFEPWQRREHDLATWTRIAEVHRAIAARHHLRLIPVGTLWAMLPAEAPLRDPLSNHAAPFGAAFTAAALARLALGESTRRLNSPDFPPSLVSAAQDALSSVG